LWVLRVSSVLVGVRAGYYLVVLVRRWWWRCFFIKDAATYVGEVVSRKVDPTRFPLGVRRRRVPVQGLRSLGCSPDRYCFSVGFNLSFATGVYCGPVQSLLAMELLQI
jgi:hypothetical protein